MHATMNSIAEVISAKMITFWTPVFLISYFVKLLAVVDTEPKTSIYIGCIYLCAVG